MTILRMRASFGCLQNAELTLAPGLNVLTLPNESGKSTWAQFLLAMFYGVDTGERAKAGSIPAKTKYKPWSGAPMAGEIELDWEGRIIILERTSRGRTPMGQFRAYEKDSGVPVPELTAENCGRVLLGVERSVLAVLCDAYDEEVVGQDKKGNDDVRVVLHFHPALAPFKAAILPLSKKDVLAGPAMELYNELSKEFMVDYDETGSIGKRYRREDEIGTPYCITFDFDTVGDEANGIAADHCVTIRERDSMEQVRIPIDQVKDFLREKCAF